MTNLLNSAMQSAMNAASNNPWVAGGMIAGGVLLIVGQRVFDKWRERKARK